MKTIAIISALQEELNFLLSKPDLEWSDLYEIENGLTVRECNFNCNVRLVAAHAANKMGLTETAILVGRIINGVKPDLLAMIGVCGGLKHKGVNIGDIVVAEKSYHYQFGAFKDGRTHKEIKSCEVDNNIYTKALETLHDRRSLFNISAQTPHGMPVPETSLRCHGAPMASSDFVVKDETKLNEAAIADRKVKAVDMESYAALRASELLGVKTIIIKSVSDYADSNKGEDDNFRGYCIYTATEALLLILTHHYSTTTNAKPFSHPLTTAQNTSPIQTPNFESFSTKIDSEIQSIVLDNMTEVPGGKLCIGGKRHSNTQKEVIFDDSLVISQHLITQLLYEKVMNKNPSEHRAPRAPVHNVSWFDAIEFCNALSIAIGMHPLYTISEDNIEIDYRHEGFRLPNEAEWEYATAPDDFNIENIDKYAWYNQTTAANPRPQDVGLLLPNKYGLYDMHGNVWEWCNNYYAPYVEIDDFWSMQPFNKSIEKAIRGGAWNCWRNGITPTTRKSSLPRRPFPTYGFRVILNTSDHLKA